MDFSKNTWTKILFYITTKLYTPASFCGSDYQQLDEIIGYNLTYNNFILLYLKLITFYFFVYKSFNAAENGGYHSVCYIGEIIIEVNKIHQTDVLSLD